MWWLLILAASLVPDSITSGYSVPCTRKRASLWSAATSSKTLMKVSPMILRFCLGVGDPGQGVEEPVGRLHVDQVDVEVGPEGLLDLLGLACPQQAVVDEHAGQLVADRLVDQSGCHRRVDASREATDHLGIADLAAGWPPPTPR